MSGEKPLVLSFVTRVPMASRMLSKFSSCGSDVVQIASVVLTGGKVPRRGALTVDCVGPWLSIQHMVSIRPIPWSHVSPVRVAAENSYIGVLETCPAGSPTRETVSKKVSWGGRGEWVSQGLCVCTVSGAKLTISLRK